MCCPNQNLESYTRLFSSADHFFLIYFFPKKYFAIPPTTHIHFQANYTLKDNHHKDDYSILSQGKAQSNKQDNFPWSVSHFFPLDDESLNPYSHAPQKRLKQPLFPFSSCFLPLLYSSSYTLPNLQIANKTLLFTLVTEKNEAIPNDPAPLLK